jgi:hypothetical protein
VGTGINVPLVRGGGGGEVAANERFEDFVAAEGDEAAVVRVGRVLAGGIGGEAVVEVTCIGLSWSQYESLGEGDGV